MKKPFVALSVAAATASLLVGCASAAPNASRPTTPADRENSELRDIATQPSSDREAKLLEKAQKQGKVLVYSTNPVDDLNKIGAAFEAKYKVPVEFYRGGSTGALINRITTEAKAGQLKADVLFANDDITSAIDSEGILAPYKPADEADYPAELKSSPNTFPVYVNYWMWAYNKDKVDKSELPHTYEDLLDPQWRGKITIARYADWLSVLWGIIGEDKAPDYFKALKEQQPFIAAQFTPALLPVVSGEKEITLSTVSGVLAIQKDKGAPIEGYFPDEPTPARTNAVGWIPTGQNPEGGLLFAEFLLSRDGGQQLMKEANRVPADRQVPPEPASLRPDKFVLVNYDSYGPNEDMWLKRFDEFLGKSS